MGLVYENITLKNAIDVGACRRGILGEAQIRQLNIKAMVDTGADMLAINEEIRKGLGLEVQGKKSIRLANEAAQTCQFTEPIEIHWKDRHITIQALVLDGLSEVLLGAIPLEGLNVVVDPGNQQLVGAYGDEVIYKVK